MHNVVYLLALLIPFLIWNGYRIYDKHFSKRSGLATEPVKAPNDGVRLDDVTSVSSVIPKATNENNQLHNETLPHPYIDYDFTIEGTIYPE